MVPSSSPVKVLCLTEVIALLEICGTGGRDELVCCRVPRESPR